MLKAGKSQYRATIEEIDAEQTGAQIAAPQPDASSLEKIKVFNLFFDLPVLIQMQILSLLDQDTLSTVRKVCQLFYSLANDSSLLKLPCRKRDYTQEPQAIDLSGIRLNSKMPQDEIQLHGLSFRSGKYFAISVRGKQEYVNSHDLKCEYKIYIMASSTGALHTTIDIVLPINYISYISTSNAHANDLIFTGYGGPSDSDKQHHILFYDRKTKSCKPLTNPEPEPRLLGDFHLTTRNNYFIIVNREQLTVLNRESLKIHKIRVLQRVDCDNEAVAAAEILDGKYQGYLAIAVRNGIAIINPYKTPSEGSNCRVIRSSSAPLEKNGSTPTETALVEIATL